MSSWTLGPYRIERELGRGGVAVVHLAEDTRLARRIALKVFPPDFTNGDWLARKVRLEVELCARLAHPGICAIHDTGVADGRTYIAMRYVEGESLARWLEREHPLPETLRLVEEVARTVHRAHELGVVHGDLKPANVMVASDGTPVILDFGSARDAEGPALDGGAHFSGTPAYAAPEQIQSDFGRPDRRSDVFALGVILYEGLTGRRPFGGSNPESVFRAVLSQSPPSVRERNPRASRDLEALVGTALAKRQDERYQTALDLAEDLRRVREDEPIRVRRAGLGKRYLRWLRRRPLVAGGLTALAGALAAGVGLSGWFLVQDRSALAGVRRLSDSRAVAILMQREAEEVWPRLARGVPAMDAWLAEAATLLERRAAYAADGDPRSREHVDALDALRPIAARVAEQRAEATALAIDTLDAHRGEWEGVIAAIADARENPLYEGLRIAPQEGLVPLGRDPDSRLHEFGHPQTGVVPARDLATGRLRIEEGSSLVFVLFPGGTFRMGAVPPGPGHPLGSPNVDPGAGPEEGPVHAVTLDPFLISKYEVSNAQWVRLGGEEPSAVEAGLKSPDLTEICTEEGFSRFPVKGIRWDEAMLRLGRLGLTLPTEAQLEYATRAGTSTAWWFGDDSYALLRLTAFGRRWYSPETVSEGFPNPFGLLHVHDHAPELVLDWFGSYELPVRPGDGLRLVEGETWHVKRGGGNDSESGRSAQRTQLDWGGLRPARALEP